MYKLYKLSKKFAVSNDEQYNVKKFKPDFLNLSINPNEKNSFKSKLARLYFYIITKGNFDIYYVEDNNEIVHTSYVVGKCFKFYFMKKGDFEIGPCFTNKEHRGKGIYPCVLKSICCDKYNPEGSMYIFVHENNKSSIRGIEKLDPELIGNLKKCKLGIYRKLL